MHALAIARVSFAVSFTLQYVSGMSYLAAVVLAQEPDEAIAYATLVILLQVIPRATGNVITTSGCDVDVGGKNTIRSTPDRTSLKFGISCA